MPAAETTPPVNFQVLVLCTHNSARSVLGEAMLNHLARQLNLNVRAFSAGSSPSGRVNPLALEALAHAGIETKALTSKSWDCFVGPDAPAIDLVITVCDRAAQETCPVFFGPQGSQALRLHWGYPDPSLAPGGETGQRIAFELTRQAIGFRMLQLLALPLASMSNDRLRMALDRIGRS